MTDSEGEENRTQSDEDGFVPGSPTPSVATTYGGMEEEDWKEGMECIISKTFEGENGSGDHRRKQLQRSYSVPVKMGKEDKNQGGDKSTRDVSSSVRRLRSSSELFKVSLLMRACHFNRL